MSPPITFGALVTRSGVPEPLVELTLRTRAIEYIVQWSRCGMTADYLADFFSYCFRNRKTAKAVLSTVINELLENAVKFSSERRLPLTVSVKHLGGFVLVETSSTTDEKQVRAFENALSELQLHGAEELFYRTVAQPVVYGQMNAPTKSRLGLILLKKDYDATLGVRMEASREEPSSWNVVVQVQVPADEVDQG